MVDKEEYECDCPLELTGMWHLEDCKKFAPRCLRCLGPCEPDRRYCELCRGFEGEEM